MRIRLVAGGLAVVVAAVVVTTAVEASVAGVSLVGPGGYLPRVSRDGTFVVFLSRGIQVRNTTTGQLERVDVNRLGLPPNSGGGAPAISADGRYVTFYSNASDLVPSDTNGFGDVFRRDLVNHTTELVSLAGNGDQADHQSYGSAISADGRYVAFASMARNLPGGPSSSWQIYLRDMTAGTTVLVSATAAGTAGNADSERPSISDNGRFVAYSSAATDLVVPDTNQGILDVYRWDRLYLTQTQRVTVNNRHEQADGSSTNAAISGNGRYVAFDSRATNLGLPNPTGGRSHVYLRDDTTQTTDRISLNSNYQAGDQDSFLPSISYDGRYVAFESGATNLVPLDGNHADDVFVRDRVAKSTVRVSLTETGAEPSGSSFFGAITADATLVAFTSVASNVVTPDHNGEGTDVFIGPAPGANPPPTPTRSLLPAPTEWRPPSPNPTTTTVRKAAR